MSHAEPIRSEDAEAVRKLSAKIAEAEARQDKMKRANAIIRGSKVHDQKVARLDAECGIREHIAQKLLVPDYAGRLGYPPFLLTNNQANIRRMRVRLAALGKEAERAAMTVAFPGGRMEDNPADCRVRIYHDAKPAAAVIQQLKANGFHWTPSRHCWQRLRNESARLAAARITGGSWIQPGFPIVTGPLDAREPLSTGTLIRLQQTVRKLKAESTRPQCAVSLRPDFQADPPRSGLSP